MVKGLNEKDQSKALKYGIIGAYVFRGIALILVESILKIWWLKPIGGLYLIWICTKHFSSSLKNNVEEETHAIHGGAVPLITQAGFAGILIISGLPQVDDHLFAVEVLTEFLARKGELL